MQVKRLLCASAVALAAAAASPTTVAAPCGGFTDVDDTVVGPLFCQNVEWVKNRGVAAGCTATTYCPGVPTSRLAMAAFLNRLGDVLTPVLLRKRETARNTWRAELQHAADGLRDRSAASHAVRQRPRRSDSTVTGYPRTAVITALLNAFTPSDASFTLQAQLVLLDEQRRYMADDLRRRRVRIRYVVPERAGNQRAIRSADGRVAASSFDCGSQRRVELPIRRAGFRTPAVIDRRNQRDRPDVLRAARADHQPHRRVLAVRPAARRPPARTLTGVPATNEPGERRACRFSSPIS